MNLRLIPLVLAGSIGCVASVRAGDASPKAPSFRTEEVAANPSGYVLKNKSTFTATSDQQRAPFWPIGWTKRQAAQATAASPTRVVEVPKVVLDVANYKVTSILLGSPSFAIVNGRTYSEGEFLRPKLGSAAAVAPSQRIRIYRINDGNVVLQCQDQLITVGLHRPELVQRSGTENLLTEDRP